MKKKRTWIILGVIAILIVGGVYLATRSATAQPAGFAQLSANVPTARVIRTTLSNSVESSGSVSPAAKAQLSFRTTGTVEQVNVVPGDRVKQGDVLATLDSSDLQLKVAQAEQAYLLQQFNYSSTVQADPSDVAVAQASYDSAAAAYSAALQDYRSQGDKQAVQCSQLTTARLNLDRAQAAYDRLANDAQAKNYLSGDWGPFQNVVNGLTDAQAAYDLALANCNISTTGLNDSALKSAQVQLQNAQNNLNSLLAPRGEKQIQAAAQLEQARLSLEQAKQNLEKTILRAPFDGVITAVNIQPGGAAGSSAAIELADTRQLHVDVLVDETLIASVKPGQSVELTLDAAPGITLTGTVERIDPSGTVSQGVVNYNVRVNLDPTEAAVRLDMTANANILGERHENVLAVPATAVRTMGQGGFGGQLGQGGFTGRGAQSDQSGQTAPDGQGAQGTRQRLTGSFVLVLVDGQPRPVPVTVGLTAGDLTEVSGDLQEGDEVLAGELTLPTGTNGARGGFFGGPPGGMPGGGPPPF
jgi:HlyD family secretion protein